MTEIKYAVHPGWIKSANNRDLHFVTAGQLFDLYGVNPEECTVISNGKVGCGLTLRELTHLFPRYDGDYRIPESS